MYEFNVYCERGHPARAHIDDDGLVHVPDECPACVAWEERMARPSRYQRWREQRKFRRDLDEWLK